MAGTLTISASASASESIRILFTFSQEAKAEYLIELTDRRVEEMEIASSNKIANRYVKHFQQLETISGKVSKEKQEQIATQIKEASLRQQKVLAEVYSQAPEQVKEAILKAQENSSKHVEKLIESIQGSEEAQEYKAQAVQIQQMTKLQKQERIEQVPMEGSPQANPSESIPKELNEGRGLNPAQELKPLNPIFEGGNQSEGGNRAEPVAPAPMQPLAERR